MLRFRFRSGKSCRDDGHLIDFLRVAAAGEVVDRGIQTLQDRAIGSEAAEALGDFIADVAGLDLGENEGVGITGDLAARELQLADNRANCISPSMATSGAFSLAMAVASRTRSTLAPLPEPLVE